MNPANEFYLKGEYLYINGNCIRFDTDGQAEEFLILLLKENFMNI